MKYKNFYIVDNGNNDGIFKLNVGGDKVKLVNDENSTRKVRVVSNTSNNNSVESYIYNDNLGIKSCITIATRGNDYFSCYQDDYTVTIVRALLLYTEKFELNKYIAFYICSLLRKNAYKCNYGRVLSGERLKLEKISLPIKGNGQPDWQYIEARSKVKYDDIISRVDKKPTKNVKISLNEKEWKYFTIAEMFKIELSDGDLMIKKCIEGSIPLISASNMNNGVSGFIDEYGDGKAQIFSGNKITVDMFCKAYYQPHDFYAVSHGRVNILSPRFSMTRLSALFVCCVINKENIRFSYGRAVYSGVISNLAIKLPVDLNGNPDWQFMEDYIKALPYSANL